MKGVKGCNGIPLEVRFSKQGLESVGQGIERGQLTRSVILVHQIGIDQWLCLGTWGSFQKGCHPNNLFTFSGNGTLVLEGLSMCLLGFHLGLFNISMYVLKFCSHPFRFVLEGFHFFHQPGDLFVEHVENLLWVGVWFACLCL